MFEFFKKRKLESKSEDKVAKIVSNDTALQNYQQKAESEIGYLINFMASHEKDDELFRYAVKTNFIENDNSEHMWVQVNEFKDGKFIGRLANEPKTIKLINYGDAVTVVMESVEDWILEDFLTNTKVGGYSSQYIRDKANKQ